MYDLKPQARPYAKAAFLAAVEEGQINEMFGDLKVLSEACSDSSINKLIESPEEKSVVVSTLPIVKSTTLTRIPGDAKFKGILFFPRSPNLSRNIY